MYTVYCLYNSENDKIYIGQTKDLSNRMALHKDNLFENSYTSRFSGDWKVIYTEKCDTRKEALKRERQLKSYQGREFVKKYIPA